MSNPESTKAEYLKVLLDLKKDPNNEIIHILQVAEEENSIGLPFQMATYSNLSNPVFDVLMCLSKFHSIAIINSITDTNWKDVEKDIKLDRSEAHGMKAERIKITIFDFQPQGEPIVDFKLEMHGNKRNERNEIYRKRLDDEDAMILYRTLKGNTFVVGLDLGYNNIGDEGAQCICSLLQETMVLQSLVLTFNDIGPKGATAIAKGIQMNETLRLLKLNRNKIGNKGGMAIAGALQVNTILETLDLAETGLTTESMIAFATVLNYNKSIKSINLNRPILFSHQEETTVHIAKMLKTNDRLRELHIQLNDIRNFGAERLAEHLVHNEALTILDLSCNRISRDGALCLSNLLNQNTPLEVLNLGYNRVEDEGAVYLSDALSTSNVNLVTLVLCGNTINGKGLCALAKALKINQTLKQIYIWGNNLEESACWLFIKWTSRLWNKNSKRRYLEKVMGKLAFKDILEGVVSRIDPADTDVRPYEVDGKPYLARVSSPY